MPLVEIKNASYTYSQITTPALANINLQIEKGEYVSIIGTNGSGKSTLARIIANFIKPDAGTYYIEENVLPGIVFQTPKEQIIAGVVERDTAFGPQNLKMSKSEIELRTMECLSVTGLIDKYSSRTFELSLGQTQRLALSGILALFPDILILDEVTAMLDPSSRKEIIDLVKDWNRKGHTVVQVTHDKDEALNASRVVVLNKGEIVFDGATLSFKENINLVDEIFCDEKFYKDLQNEKSKLEIAAKKIDDENYETTLCAKNISFEYPELKVFTNISFSLRKGTLTSLTGPSGCGKSTLLECLAGLKSFSSGKLFSTERPVLSLQESEAALFEQFASDDVAFGARNKGVSGKKLLERVKKSMALADLPFETFAERQTFFMSGGEKRKLSLAGIIALNSDIMLFDEPTAGLDPESRKAVITTLRNLAKEGKTVLFTTHRMEEAQSADEQISWEELTSNEIKNDSFENNNQEKLKEQAHLENSEMISSLQKVSNSFMAPPVIKKSLVSIMPPVLKYILFLTLFISSLAVRPLYLCAIMLALCVAYNLISKYSIKNTLFAFVKLFPWLLLFALFQFLFFPASEGENLLVQWGIFTISNSKIKLVVCMILRTASAVFSIGTFIHTTSEREILDGLDSLLKPLSIIKIPVRYAVLVVGIIFRFIPLLIEEACNIIKTQLVRGGLGKVKGLKKIKKLLPLFVPLMIQTFRKAEIFADALSARYFK
ncbi:MAG: energy-coupling factor transporter ATPase [Treponema sp.]